MGNKAPSLPPPPSVPSDASASSALSEASASTAPIALTAPTAPTAPIAPIDCSVYPSPTLMNLLSDSSNALWNAEFGNNSDANQSVCINKDVFAILSTLNHENDGADQRVSDIKLLYSQMLYNILYKFVGILIIIIIIYIL